MVSKDDPKLDTLISVVKEREASGYAYEGADASFELLALKTLGTVPDFFAVESFRVMVERRFDSHGKLKTVSEAVVKVLVDGEMVMSVAEGDGPVNALDIALRKEPRFSCRGSLVVAMVSARCWKRADSFGR